MGNEYTPTTEYVRTVYGRCPVDSLNGGDPNPTPEYAEAQFERWLAARDAEVARKAKAEALAPILALADQWVDLGDRMVEQGEPASRLVRNALRSVARQLRMAAHIDTEEV